MEISLPVKVPARQGFFKVTLKDGTHRIAEWREHDKSVGKVWWEHVGDKPTDVKKPVRLDGVVAFDKATQAEIEAALARELTEEERIEAAYKRFVERNKLWKRRPIPIPEVRRLHVGQRLEIGNLRQCTVVGLREDEQVVVVRHVDKASRDNPRDKVAYDCWYWHDTVPLDTVGEENRFSAETVFAKVRTTTRVLDALVQWWLRQDLQDDTVYQRGYIWADADKDRFIDSVFEEAPLGSIVILNRKYPVSDELVDGKQRLNCLVEFMTSQRAYRGVYWHQLSPADRRVVEDRTVPVMELEEGQVSPVDVCDIFLRINAAGVPQTEEHLERVRRLREQLAEVAANNAKKA